MMFTKFRNHIVFREQSQELRDRGLAFVTEYFPDMLPLIMTYATEQGANPGDIALLTITEVIIPELEDAKHLVPLFHHETIGPSLCQSLLHHIRV